MRICQRVNVNHGHMQKKQAQSGLRLAQLPTAESILMVDSHSPKIALGRGMNRHGRGSHGRYTVAVVIADT
jgi:hypothetical protein